MIGFIAPWLVAGIVAFVAGCFWGFISAGERLRTGGKPLSAGGTIGLTFGFLAACFGGYTAMTFSVGLLALGVMSDGSNTMSEVLPFVIGLGIVGTVALCWGAWMLVFLVRLAHASHTDPKS